MASLTNMLLNFLGITQPPASVAELIWDFLLIVMGLVVIKLMLSFFFGLMKSINFIKKILHVGKARSA